MDRTLQILEAFLANCGAEVQGRGAQSQPPELRERLRAFAKGQSSAADRASLAAVLKEHPEWVAWLADQIKAQRPQAGSHQP